MNELEDEMKNLKKLMKMITELYKKYTKLKPNKLDEILKHDIWWDSKECLKVGLVDEIFKNQQVYEFDRKKLDL